MATETVADLEGRIAELEKRIRDMEHREENGIEAFMRRLLPDDVRGHLRTARKEQLLAIRTMLDHLIEKAESQPTDTPVRRESIKVE